ncbi:unnamed protein product [Clonostachys chloroleuca]|uniref:Uncharacterized protein n=1 Tax=Clonostachys chloroleuca TaxID=1926264 RepID=A0AA35LZF1_9HYPO|nr:unnamed protein product [Clonostachys chloroleuca]
MASDTIEEEPSKSPQVNVDPTANDPKAYLSDQDEAGKVGSFRSNKSGCRGTDVCSTQFLQNYDVASITASATDSDYSDIVRKLDRLVLPLLFGTYALQCIDKSCLGYASVFTLSKDLGLVGKQYSWLSSLFYFGYLVFEYPTTLLSQKFPIGRFIGVAIVLWGGILIATAGAQNFAGMAVLRFILGGFESLITPTFVLINGMYYTRKEQVLRTGAWACANGFGCTLVFIFLPASPMTARFLTEKQRVLAVHRIRSNKTGILNRQFKWNQVQEALNPFRDPQGLLLFLTIYCNEVLNGGFGAFGTLTIQSFGFDSLQSTLIYIPQGFINMVCILFGGWLAQKLPNARIYVCIGMLVPTFIGLLLQIVLPRSNVAGLLIGVYLFPPFATCLFIVLSLPGVNSSGYTKRITLSSYAFFGYALGNITGPFTVKPGETPAYRSVFIADIICIGLQGKYCVLRYMFG